MILHVCCGPCLADTLPFFDSGDRDAPVLFYSNSNILSREEWDKRLESLRRLAEHLGFRVEADPYDHAAWLNAVKGLEDVPEGGERCSRCFRFNLERAAAFAERENGTGFATTLTVSRYKDSGRIFAAGEIFDRFLPVDFKNEGDPARGRELCRELNLYRQKFCGCEFALRQQRKK